MNRSRSWSFWPSFPGPVFGRELRSAARGPWFYLVRALAAAALTGYIASSVPLQEAMVAGGEWSPGRIAALAGRIFRTFEAAQFCLVLALVPLLVASSVAEEKARGTLALILASRLSSFEIIADKLLARLLIVLVLVVTGLPVLAMIGLLGGVDPGELAISLGVTLASAWMVASLSMLVSVYARSASGAVVGAYAASLSWLVLPVWFAAWLGRRTGPPGVEDWVRSIASHVAISSPLSFMYIQQIRPAAMFGMAGLVGMLQEMASLEVAGGLMAFGLSAWRLRPVYRVQVDGGRRNWIWLGRLARLAGLRERSRPACGDDPMAWKERYTPESAALARLFQLAGLALVAQAIWFHLFTANRHLLFSAFDEMYTEGSNLGAYGVNGSHRNALNHILCNQAGILFGVGLVASTILAASGIAGERGRGTWPGLLGTPLDRRAIIRAKIWGAIGPIRGLLALILALYLASMAATALHPVGFLMVMTAGSAFLWSSVALGTWVSSQSKSAGSAIVRTLILLAAINSVPSLILYRMVGQAAVMAAMPVMLIVAPMSPMRYESLFRLVEDQWSASLFFWMFAGIVTAHSVGAWWLTSLAGRRIERDEG